MVGRMETHLAAPPAPRACVYAYETFGTTPEGECERPDLGPHRLEQDLLGVLLRLHGQHPIVQVPQVIRIRIRFTAERFAMGSGSAAIRGSAAIGGSAAINGSAATRPPGWRWDSSARHVHHDLVSILFDESTKLLVDQEP